jgi:2-deoxy-D-gluconate 3-dehydrogenase
MDTGYLAEQFGLEGRNALVTGAKTGIGAAIAVALARCGANVAVTSRDVAGLAEVTERIRAAGSRALAISLEVRDLDQVDDAVETAVAELGGLDILVNNAGVSTRIAALDYAAEDWDAVLETNLRGSFFMARAAARHMLPRRSGRIINLSSTYGRVARAKRAAYVASKGGVEQLTRALALEWAPDGVTVNAIAPAAVPTPTRRDVLEDPAEAARRVAEIPLGRLCLPADVVGAAIFLASPSASFITGHTILVDGGYTLP